MQSLRHNPAAASRITAPVPRRLWVHLRDRDRLLEPLVDDRTHV